MRDVIDESPAYFAEADRLMELSSLIDENVSDPEAREVYNFAISESTFVVCPPSYRPADSYKNHED